MGIPCIESIQDCGWNYSNTLSLLGLVVSGIGVVVNALVAWWIVRTVQNGLHNRRVLKDHFIKEIGKVNDLFDGFFEQLLAGEVRPKEVIPWFKRTNIRVDALAGLINRKYGLSTAILEPFQIELRNMITEDEHYIASFAANNTLKFPATALTKLYDFQSTNGHLFNEIIILINDAEISPTIPSQLNRLRGLIKRS